MARDLTNDENQRMDGLRAAACRARAIAHELDAAALDIEAVSNAEWYIHAGRERKMAADERAEMRKHQSNAANYARAVLIDAARLNPPATNTGD
jgi:hypothetical protein